MTRVYHLEKFAVLTEAVKPWLTSLPGIQYLGHDDEEHLLIDGMIEKADVLILDASLFQGKKSPVAEVFSLCKLLLIKKPALEIVLHSPYRSSLFIDQFIKAGVFGFVSKYSGVEHLQKAIESVADGKFYACPAISSEFSNFEAFAQGKNPILKPVKGLFSSRELQVLPLLAQGYSTRRIAEELNIKVKTVETHRKKLALKAGVKNTVELIEFTCRTGLLIL